MACFASWSARDARFGLARAYNPFDAARSILFLCRVEKSGGRRTCAPPTSSWGDTAAKTPRGQPLLAPRALRACDAAGRCQPDP